jgi:hypothetical protein
MKKIIKLLLLTCFLTSCDSSGSKEEVIDKAKLHETEELLSKALFSIRFGMSTNIEPIPSPLEFMAAGCGQVRKKTWKANLPSMSQIRVL